MQTNSTLAQFELVEANLQNLSARVADVPATGILLCRLLMHIGREMATMFEQQIGGAQRQNDRAENRRHLEKVARPGQEEIHRRHQDHQPQGDCVRTCVDHGKGQPPEEDQSDSCGKYMP